MKREESSAPAPQGKFNRKRKSSIVAERASIAAHNIKPEKEMKKKKLRAKTIEIIEAFIADKKAQLQSSKSLLMEQEAMVEEIIHGEVTLMRKQIKLLSMMNLHDQLLADFIYYNLL